jgi:hypothetical protein
MMLILGHKRLSLRYLIWVQAPSLTFRGLVMTEGLIVA